MEFFETIPLYELSVLTADSRKIPAVPFTQVSKYLKMLPIISTSEVPVTDTPVFADKPVEEP